VCFSFLKTQSGIETSDKPSNHLRDDGADEVVDTALVDATDETDVTILSPVCSPRVLDDPVLLAILLTITDKENTMVHGLSRARLLIDAIVVEAPEGGIDSNRKRAVGVESSNHGILVLIDGEPLGEVILDLLLVKLASLVNTAIRIHILINHAVLDSILEHIGHQTTLATLIADLLSGARIDHALLITIDNLLLRDGRKLLVGKEPDTLHVASSRESIARAALLLILDRSDSTFLSPVLVFRIVLGRNIGHSGTRHLVDRNHTEVLGSELLLSKISKLVQLEDSTAALTVEVTDKSVVALESIEAVNMLLSTVVHLAVLKAPIDEDIIDVSSENTADEKCQDEILHYYKQ